MRPVTTHSVRPQVAQQADAVVLVMGLDQTQEREGMDRTIISFPGVQDQLIAKVATCAGVRISRSIDMHGTQLMFTFRSDR